MKTNLMGKTSKIAGSVKFLLAGVALSMASLDGAFAATRYWTGAGGDNEWTNTLNWSSSAMPGSGDTAVFENDTPLSVRIHGSGYLGATHFKFNGADVTFGSDDDKRKTFYIYGSATSTLDVVSAGTTVTISNLLSMYHSNNLALAKKGKGTFRFVGDPAHVSRIDGLKQLVVEEGELGGMLASGGYGVYVTGTTTNILVRSGAAFFINGYNAIDNDVTTIDLEEGATFRVNTNGGTDKLARISGKGTICAPGSSKAQLKLTFAKGPCRFSGTVASGVTLDFVENASAPASDMKFYVGAAESLADATVNDYAGALAFEPGVGAFSIGTYAPYFKELVLEDTSGMPVSLSANISGASRFAASGAGSLHVTGADATFTNRQIQIGGGLSIDNHTMTFGNGSADADADLSTISGLGTRSGVLSFRNTGDTVLDIPVEGPGKILASGAVAFSDLRMTNTEIEVSAGGRVTLAGGSSTLSQLTFGAAGATIEVTGGMYSGKRTLKTLETSSALPVPSFIPTAYAAGTIRVSGGELWLDNKLGYVSLLELLGGNCVMGGSYSANSAATDENPYVILIDGGTMTVGLRGSQYWWWMPSSASSKIAIRIGAKGARFATRDRIGSYSDSVDIAFSKGMSTADGVASDGGVTFDLRRTGCTAIPLEPFLVNGPVVFMDGRVSVFRYSASSYADIGTYPSFFGTGDFTLDCSQILYDKTSSATSLPEGTLRLASGSGSRFRVRGASSIRFRTGTDKPQQHVVAGADGALPYSVFVRERGGAFYLQDAGLAVDGERSSFKVNGGVETNGCTTLVKAPIFSFNTVNSNVGDDTFLCYDADKGFVEFNDYKTSLAAGENAVVRANGCSLAANASAHVAAIQLVNWGIMTLNAGSRLTVGNGTDPACVLLGYETDISGSGTIDFGASEGVVSVGPCGADDYGHAINCSFAGSGGMSYVSMPHYSRRVACLSAASTYTGDTYVSAAAIRVRNAKAFSDGGVHVLGGYRNGGKLIFDRPVTLANNLHVSGGGHRLHEYVAAGEIYGAIAFTTNEVFLSGCVELTADTEVMSTGEGTFMGTISGGRLVAKPGAGRIVLAASNTYTGGTEIVRTTIALSGASPSVGTGMVSLDKGTLRFENTSPIVFTNDIEGVGTIVVAGAAVTFAGKGLDGLEIKSLAAGSSFDYPCFTNPVYVVSVGADGLDLGGRDVTVAGVAGSGRVSGGVLTVTGEINPAGAGTTGTLVFGTPPVLSGATYVCDVSGDATDRVEFEDDVDVSGLALRVVRNGQYGRQLADVLFSSGKVTGTFASESLPKGRYSLEYGESAVTLKHPCGIVIGLR